MQKLVDLYIFLGIRSVVLCPGPITLPLLEELNQVVNLFYSLAASVPAAANSNPIVERVLQHCGNVGDYKSCRHCASYCKEPGRLACQRSTDCSSMFTFGYCPILRLISSFA